MDLPSIDVLQINVLFHAKTASHFEGIMWSSVTKKKKAKQTNKKKHLKLKH